MYSMSLYRYDAGSESSITIRVGTGTNLSSVYAVEITCTVPAGSGWFECVIPEGSRPQLTASTLYYSMWRTTGTGWNGAGVTTTDAYAGGTRDYDTSPDWTWAGGTGDYAFRVSLCE